MARFLVVVVVLASFITLAHGYCFFLKAGETEIDGKKITYCKLEDETVKEAGESWVDKTNCLFCTCNGQCCTFGFRLLEEMNIEHECKAVKTGDGCWDFKFVQRSDPSVDCLNPPTLPALVP